MRHFLLVFIFLSCLATLLPSCEPKEDLVQTSGSLEFSADTVLFDTVFTTVRTVTKRLWAYNRNSGAVKTDISLGGAQGATYSLIINGDTGPAASSVTIRGNDSVQILVRATLGDNGTSVTPKEFIVTDQVNFLTNGNAQNVKLVAYGQNAYFHRADFINGNVTWPTDKPHVIINRDIVQAGTAYSVGVQVNPGATLNILPGTRIYCHAGATLVVAGTLRVNANYVPGTGATDTVKATNINIVRFQGDRLESAYADVPGQWAGILFAETSRNNLIRYAEIKNANVGVYIDNSTNLPTQPDVTLENTVIKNISGSNPSYVNNVNLPGGIVSILGNVKATNCLITNCGEYAILGLGGTYDINFCTIANYTTAVVRRETSSLTFTNKPGTAVLPLALTLRNSIVWGGIEDELLLDGNASYNSLNIRNSLLRTKEYAGTASTTGTPGLAATNLANVVNQDPKFLRDPTRYSVNLNFGLDATSPALNRVPVTAPTTVPDRDLINLPRSRTQPDLGAYERQ